MTKMPLIAAALTGALAATLSATPAISREKPTGAEKLAKMLEGRVAGEPQNCIRTFPTSNLTVIDGTALVYKRGKTLYVNIPRNAKSIDDSDALVTRTTANRLCRQDIVTTIDRHAGNYTGNIFLGDFVPYTKEG